MDNLTWHTSSYSANGTNCVEVAHDDKDWHIRDTKSRTTGTLRFGDKEWNAFLGSLR